MTRHLRTLARAPLFTAVAGLSLALGIAGTTVIFSLVDALLLRPPPVSEPARLVRIGATEHGQAFVPVSHPEYMDLKTSVQALEGLVAYQFNSAVLTVGAEPAMGAVELVSGNFFDVLGVRVSPGRGFRPDEDAVPGRDAVVVISHALWQSRFGGDPGAIGSSIRVNGHPFTVIGVAADGFRGAFGAIDMDLWAPVMMQAQVLPASGDFARRDNRFLMLIGRLRPGSSREELRAQLGAVAPVLAAADPHPFEEPGYAIAEVGGVHPVIGSVIRRFLALLMGMMGVVLLIACANVANLMLARVSARERDIAVRSALGASNWRIAREFLAEGLLLSVLGGIAGLLISVWATKLLSLWRPAIGVPVALDLRVDGRVMLFAAVMTAGTALLFSIGPALRAARSRPGNSLRDRTTTGPQRLRARRVLVVAQIAMSTLLLVGAGLLVRSIGNSGAIDTGFDDTDITTITAEPQLLGYNEERGRALWLELEQRVRALPGVDDASLALFVPLGDRSDAVAVSPADRPSQSDPRADMINYNIVDPGYFRMLDIALLRGRDFAVTDVVEGEPVSVISEALAARFWPGEDAVGREVRVGWDGGDRIATIAGIVENVKYRTLGEAARPVMYLSFAQWYRADMILHVRSQDPATAATVVSMLHSIEPDLPADVAAMSSETTFSLIPLRLAGSVMGVAGALGLFLAATGVFGIVAYTVSRQVRDIAIRMALGADRGGVRTMVVRRAVGLTLTGLALGGVVAVLAARLLSGMLYGVSGADPAVLASVTALFLGVTALAAYGPARRASGVDPAIVLREE